MFTMRDHNENTGCFDSEHIETTVSLLRSAYPALALELRNSLYQQSESGKPISVDIASEKVRAIIEVVSDECFELVLCNEDKEGELFLKTKQCLEAWIVHAQCLIEQ